MGGGAGWQIGGRGAGGEKLPSLIKVLANYIL